MQTGDEVRIAGHGDAEPDARGGNAAAGRPACVQVKVETPRNLTKRQEELFRELAEIDRKNVSPERKSFLDQIKAFFTPEAPAQERPGTS